MHRPLTSASAVGPMLLPEAGGWGWPDSSGAREIRTRDIPGKGQDPSPPRGDQLTGESASGPRTPCWGPALWSWVGLKEVGFQGLACCLWTLPFTSLCHLAQYPCHPICPNHPPACSVSTGGLLLDPRQAVLGFRYLGTPTHSYLPSTCSGLRRIVSDMILSLLLLFCFTQRGEFTCLRLHSP